MKFFARRKQISLPPSKVASAAMHFVHGLTALVLLAHTHDYDDFGCRLLIYGSGFQFLPQILRSRGRGRRRT